MNPDLNHIPNDPETTILFELHSMFDDIPACYQAWQHENTSGERIIFLNKDLKGRKDTELMAQVKASNLVQLHTPVTLSRKQSDFLFINFNFKVQ